MCACDTFILFFVTDSVSCILNSFISTLLKEYYSFNGHFQPSRPFLGNAVCGKFADANDRRFVCKNSNDRSKS